MQSADYVMKHNEIEIAKQTMDIIKRKKSRLKPLNPDIIHPQPHYTKIILNAFQCLLQSQISILIHEYKVKPHLYNIIGQIWFRFLNQTWIKKGFGTKDNSQSLWIWNKNQRKLYQNNDFKEKWITPKRSY